MKPASEFELPLRITLIAPPAGVQFCLQRGSDELIGEVESTGADLSFDLSVRVDGKLADGSPRFLGPFTQGPPTSRFVYIRCGTSAGQWGSPWTRRAKIPLTGITWPLIRKGTRLEARYAGTAKDGGPSCATVPLLDGGWR